VGKKTAPGPQGKRFAAYIEGLAEAAGHADRNVPLKNYCMGLLLPGERKSVEPMAARLAPDRVRRMHQSLHHVVADAPWSDEAVLDRCLDFVLPAMLRQEPVVAWVVDDTGFPKKGHESVGVARQYCGQVGKQDNCRVAVSVELPGSSLRFATLAQRRVSLWAMFPSIERRVANEETIPDCSRSCPPASAAMG
jgi:SRSO17 transposase